MGSGSPGKPPHVCGASMCGHTCVACYPRIRSRDLGWFRMMRPWDSLRDDRAHCSAPYVISFSATTCCIFIIHQDSGDQFGRWTSCWFRRQSGSADFSAEPRLPKVWSPVSSFRFGPWDGRSLTFRRSDRSIGGTVRRLGSSSARTRCSARSVTQGAASTLFWCRPCRHSLP